MTICCDWDGTLVDDLGDWLPGALDALRWLRRQGHTVVIHSARAGWSGGRAQIQSKLDEHKLPFGIAAKPGADVYIDDKAVAFVGYWPEILRQVRGMQRAAA